MILRTSTEKRLGLGLVMAGSRAWTHCALPQGPHAESPQTPGHRRIRVTRSDEDEAEERRRPPRPPPRRPVAVPVPVPAEGPATRRGPVESSTRGRDGTRRGQRDQQGGGAAGAATPDRGGASPDGPSTSSSRAEGQQRAAASRGRDRGPPPPPPPLKGPREAAVKRLGAQGGAPTAPPRGGAPTAPPLQPRVRAGVTSELGCPHFNECSGCSLEDGLSLPAQYLEARAFFKQRGIEDFKLVGVQSSL